MHRARNASTRPQVDPRLMAALWADLRPRLARRRAPLLLGLSGLQGCGKSTLARALVTQARRCGIAAVTLSLDDVYLGRRARLALARQVHPLLATRGVPGTHDLPLLHATLDALARCSPHQPVRLPRFDKARDTRRPPSRWPRLTRPPGLVVLEGWCLGLAAQSAASLVQPCNALERREDRDGRWRRWVNARLAGYAPLWRRLDRLVLLQAPSWRIVARWRGEAEEGLRARSGRGERGMDAAALARFLQHYERLSRHALASLAARADRRFVLDARRRPRDLSRR